MNQHDFESRVLHLWMTTRVPLTRANLLFFTRAPRKKLDRWLDLMIRENVLDIDSDDEGETIWMVKGAARPSRGAERVEDVVKLEQLSSQAQGQTSGRRRGGGVGGLEGALVRQAGRGVVEQALARRGGEKSAIASGALSFVFGPLGWVYAAPLKEALPAAVLYWLLLRGLSLLPWMLAAPLLSLVATATVVAGVLYAWQYNKNGHVTPLFTGSDDDDGGTPRLGPRR